MPSDHAKKRAAKKKEMAKGKRKGAKAAEEDPEIQVRARFTLWPLSSLLCICFSLNIFHTKAQPYQKFSWKIVLGEPLSETGSHRTHIFQQIIVPNYSFLPLIITS